MTTAQDRIRCAAEPPPSFRLLRHPRLQIFPDQRLLVVALIHRFLIRRFLSTDAAPRTDNPMPCRYAFTSGSACCSAPEPSRVAGSPTLICNTRNPRSPRFDAPFQRFRRQRNLRKALQKRFEHHLRFNPRQRRSKTKVRGITERQMPIIFPRNVEVIGIGKPFGIAIRRGHHGNHRLPLLNLLSAHFPFRWTHAAPYAGSDSHSAAFPPPPTESTRNRCAAAASPPDCAATSARHCRSDWSSSPARPPWSRCCSRSTSSSVSRSPSISAVNSE